MDFIGCSLSELGRLSFCFELTGVIFDVLCRSGVVTSSWVSVGDLQKIEEESLFPVGFAVWFGGCSLCSSSSKLEEDRETGVLGWRRGWFGGGSGWRRGENGVLGEPGGFLVIVVVWCGGEERNNGVLGSFGGWLGGRSSRAGGLVKNGSFTGKSRRIKGGFGLLKLRRILG
ncbi:H/ACA ribonucleoprotein complex subunit 1-like [Solanum tuberosum]|uniref:H/ACA ribonucleoprotein complex subunit 1-like n=1 Tax=Solanum tuberosum TaxID=4113 RepID=UPI00073A1CE3|nr:PREDICTED: H/ACA ribonucleoprotein complex subunit 1-like [Solanum tuberosum]